MIILSAFIIRWLRASRQLRDVLARTEYMEALPAPCHAIL